MDNKMHKIVMVFGTFDGIHPGHIHYLSHARKYGNYLIALIARDVSVLHFKKKSPLYNEYDRMKKIAETKLVDMAILGSESDPLHFIRTIKPDIICFGYDQQSFNDAETLEKLQKMNIQIITLDAFEPEKYKSSLLQKNSFAQKQNSL